MHLFVFKHAMSEYPGNDDTRHCYASCLITKWSLGLPVPLLSGPIFEAATAVLGGSSLDDAVDDLEANFNGIIAAWNFGAGCAATCECMHGK